MKISSLIMKFRLPSLTPEGIVNPLTMTTSWWFMAASKVNGPAPSAICYPSVASMRKSTSRRFRGFLSPAMLVMLVMNDRESSPNKRFKSDFWKEHMALKWLKYVLMMPSYWLNGN